MKTIHKSIVLLLLLFNWIQGINNVSAQGAPEDAIVYTIANDFQANSKQLEFDLLLWDSVTSEPYELGTVQAGIYLDPGIINGGTLTPSIVSGSSSLVSSQQPTAIMYSASQSTIKLASRAPVACGSGTIISQDPCNRTRLCRISLTNTADFTPNSHANLTFSFTTAPYPTKISFRSQSCQLYASPVSDSNVYSMASNITLNPGPACPYPYTVTGGGNYCEGSLGREVGLSGSETGAMYTLFKDAVPLSPPIAGTGSAISFGLQLTGNYTVMATNAFCPSGVLMNGSALITELPNVVPAFPAFGPYCQGSNGESLPLVSVNGITGDWSPSSIVNTNDPGTVEYLFTPLATQCAVPFSVSITVNPIIPPVFPVFGSYCMNDPPVTLPVTTLNGITGTWSPPIVNTATAGVGAYQFIPGADVCSHDSTVLITVLNRVIPEFIQLGPFCQYTTPPVLPTNSINGITGTWNPSVINTSLTGTYSYVFTHSEGQCADSVIMQIEIGIQVVASFQPIGPFCQGVTPPALPGTSLNGFTGIWSPSTINTSSTGVFQYTFTPDAGQCAIVTYFNIEIITSPVPAGPISGMDLVYAGSSLVEYSIDPVPGATGYEWEYDGTNVTISGRGNIVTLFFWEGATSGQLSVYGYNNCGNGTASLLEISVIPPCYATTWTGMINQDWDEPGNWSAGVPNSYSEVTIPGGSPNYPLIVGGGPCKSIARLQLMSGAEIIGQQNICSGNPPIVEQIIPDTNIHFISSPITSSYFEEIFSYDALFDIYMRVYDEPTGDWINQTAVDLMLAGKGYSMQMLTAPHTANFEGTLNGTDKIVALSDANPGSDLSRIGWNLVGNPFPSAIDWDLLYPGLYDSQVAVWDETTGGYRYWNHSVGNLTEGIIPSRNGFFVKTSNPGGATLTIPLTAQVFSNHSFYKKSDVTELLVVKVEGNGYHDETFIHFNENASPNYDGAFDAFKLWGQLMAPQVYSMISSYYLSINELPFDDQQAVDLGFYCGVESFYDLTVNGIESFDPNLPIWLEDLKYSYYQDLRNNPTYCFDYYPNDSEKRFRLHFKAPIGIPEYSKQTISLYTTGNILVIQNPFNLGGEVNICDLAGRELFASSLNKNSEERIPLNIDPGIYLVRISTSTNTFGKKILIW